MTNITASMVKELRERTGLGMMDCKKALSDSDGDMEKAIEDLRKASGLKAAKKASRVAAEGVVMTKVSEDGNRGVIIEVNSETDFVARDDNFLGLRFKWTAQPVRFMKKNYKKNMITQMPQPVRRRYDVLLERYASSTTFINRATGA